MQSSYITTENRRPQDIQTTNISVSVENNKLYQVHKETSPVKAVVTQH